MALDKLYPHLTMGGSLTVKSELSLQREEQRSCHFFLQLIPEVIPVKPVE